VRAADGRRWTALDGMKGLEGYIGWNFSWERAMKSPREVS